MKPFIFAVIFLNLTTMNTFGQPKSSNPAMKTETETITQPILTQLQNAWNDANSTAFAHPFADVSEFVDIRGTLHQNASPSDIGNAHQGLWMSIYKDSKVMYHLVQELHIDQNTILANVTSELDAPTGPLAGKNNSTITLVLTKTGDAWKIKAFHNTLVVKR